MIDQWEAQLIAASTLNQDKPVGAPRAIGQHEFDLGWLLWPVLPLGTTQEVGAGRVVVDRTTGELTHWSSAPVATVVEQYRAYRAETPIAPLSWDPLARAEYLRRRAAFPETVTHLRLADGRVRIGHSMKGDGTPRHHPLVRDFLDGLPAGLRERGYQRCAEAGTLSDTLHAEDARRAMTGAPALTLASADTELLRGASLVSYRIREPYDPLGGEPVPPCRSCRALLAHLGFTRQPDTQQADAQRSAAQQGEAQQGDTRQDEAQQRDTRQGEARRDDTRQGEGEQGEGEQGEGGESR